MGFAEIKHNTTRCNAINITVVRNDSDFFITPAEIRGLITKQQGEVTGKNFDKIDVHAMELMLQGNPYVTDAQVYATLDGTLEITIIQKKPIVRIIPENNESYYLDSKGSLMPLSSDFTALTLVVNGAIKDAYSTYCNRNVKELERDTSVHSSLPGIYKLSDYISRNPFWKAQITQIYIDSALDFCLIPRVGSQRIIFGDTSNMVQKFSKLWILYNDGLNATSKWNDYTEINLKFNHQVICTKK